MPYDKSVDVYSFGILLWEMCSAEKPFFGYSSNKHMQNVVVGGERPKMDSHHTQYWPTNLQWLMKSCWDASPAARPSFQIIVDVLVSMLHGEEAVPESSVEVSKPFALDVDMPAGGLSSLFRPIRIRSKTTGGTGSIPPKESFKDAKRTQSNDSQGRGRTWGRRQMS
jgi:serine/threonine protein kinase